MKNIRASKIVLALVAATGLLTIVGNGCSRFINQSGSSDTANESQSVLPETGGNGGADIPVIPGTKTMHIVHAAAALDHFAVCSGLKRPSDRTVATYEQKKGSMSSDGKVNTITPAALMALTSLAGDVCDDLIAQDLVEPRLFINFNMSSNSMPSDTDISRAAARLAISCWERKPDDVEAKALLDMVKASVASNENLGHRKAALMTCVTVLSSLDALVN